MDGEGGVTDALNNPRLIRPYGDKTGDGVIQTSFTLPVAKSEQAREAARLYVSRLGLKDVKVLAMEAIGKEDTFFVVYACCDFDLDLDQVVVPVLEYPQLGFDAVNNLIKERIGRKITVLGACIGTDAHTVGIDAIFNMKGYMGDHGLERYPMMRALNLRAQVSTQDLVAKVVEYQADAVLISRVVTQRDSHIVELKKFLEELGTNLKAPGHLVKICGGPRIGHKDALELGYDAGFGPGTKPSSVASFVAALLAKRIGKPA